MNYKVLLVDDDPTILRLFSAYLGSQGMQVTEAVDGVDALEILKTEKFDLLVTDIRMPKMTGIELIRRSRQFQPDLPSVIVSGEGTLSEAAEAVNLKVLYYLEKPIENLETLRGVIIDAVENNMKSLEIKIKALEKELELYRKILPEVYRLPKLGAIAVGLAHNLNSPLGGIIGYAQLGKMKHPQIDSFEIIGVQAQKISKALNNISEKGQSENAAQPAEINLKNLVQDEVDFLGFNLFFKHQVEFELELNDVPQIMGVYSHFSLILHHLLQNARDAVFEKQEKRIKISTDSNGEKIFLKVSDSGKGIYKENLDRLFTPGFSTKPPPSEVSAPELPAGYGVGLWVVKQLLDVYNGDISIESREGIGTTVTVTIPVN